jgi:hypothetical protein
MRDNPWAQLGTTPPYVLPEDMPAAVPYQLHARLPEPWQGPIWTARAVLLLLNSGHSVADLDDMGRPEVVDELRAQLDGDRPFFAVLDGWADTASAKYWRPRLAKVIDEVGQDAVASGFAIAQAVPYASSYQLHHRGRITSAAFTAHLVAQAAERGAMVILARGIAEWRSLAPALFEQPGIPVLPNPRFPPNLTRERLGDALFDSLVGALRQTTRHGAGVAVSPAASAMRPART